MRIIFLAIVCFVSVVFSTGAADVDEVDLNLKEKEIAFTFFDLSNGEATLIQSKEKNTLVNTGNKSSRYELAERLEIYGTGSIDKLILTNGSEEYTGNLVWLIEHYDVHSIISSRSILNQLKEDLDLTGERFQIWTSGKKEQILPGLMTEVLFNSKEQHAMALMFTFGQQQILYMGLADEKIEKQLLEEYAVDAEILKVGEFGSNKGTIPEFLEKVDPQVAILFHKEGLLPSDQMIERLQEVWIDVYETKQVGTVTIKLSRDSYEVITISS